MDLRQHVLMLFVIGALLIVKATGCSRQLLGPNGTFSTPNFPTDYPSNTGCVWNVNLTSGATLNIRFENFSTEQCCDFVTIRNGASSTSLKGSLGSFAFPAITVEANTVIEIEFKSDSSITKEGFLGYYTISPPPTTPVPTTPMMTTPPTTGPPFLGCGGTLNGSAGSFGTPGFPGRYENNLNCIWTLHIPVDGYLWLNFRKFKTEGCCDFVELTTSTGLTIQRYKGSRASFNRKVFGNTTLTLRVRFYSDSSIREIGFLASYIIVSPPRASPVLSVSSSTATTGIPITTPIPPVTTPFTITPSTSSLAQVMSSSVVWTGAISLPPDLQRIFTNLLHSLRGIIDQLGKLLTGPITSGDIESFRNITLQILQQVQEQLISTSPTHVANLAKRASPEFPNPWELKELLEKLQQLLG